MLAHIHIMKTAGQTVCDVLRQSLPGEHCDLRAGDLATQADVDFAKRVYPRLKSIAGHSIRPHGDLVKLPGIRFFTFLREPVSRCISHFQFECSRNGRNLEFKRWLQQNSNYQTKILCGQPDAGLAIEVLKQRVQFVGLVEHFDESLELLRNWSGMPLNIRYQSRNIARDSSIKQRLQSDPVTMAEIVQRNSLDQIVYGYALANLFPQMRQHYGQSTYDSDGGTVSVKLWSDAKRNLVYKPLAKTRQWFRDAA